MKKLAIAAAALMLAGCASAPKPTPLVKVTVPKMRAIAPPAAAPEAATFKHRWYDRFLKHKSK